MWGADWPRPLRTSRRRHGQGRRVVLPLRRAKSAGARGRTGMIISNRFGLLQGVALSSWNVPRKASSCHPRLRLGIQVFVLLQGFPLPSRSVHRKASSCHQGPAKYTSGQSHAHQSQSLYDRSPHYHQTCHDYGADAGDCDDYDGEAAVHIDRAHTRLAACDALYSTQAPTTPACKALTCCPARHCPAAPTSGADENASRLQRAT